MGKRIKNHEDYELGISTGLNRSICKFVELYFDHMKSQYIGKLFEIHDRDLNEQLFDRIYTNDRSREDFESILNSIQHYHREQMGRNKESDLQMEGGVSDVAEKETLNKKSKS
ncbi:hypothetical protein [Brevibacillus choshinensis]|uniref:Uncharacterized protein n=1 Tax=Brevibacillus choshinensis TaxID=54911 RepID=A0ABX7FID2_BRECH|nr:hypothetical protein [Brevibacillus choshinensis]QRG65983.1 hypothetical protein JNE38_20715 [Brevibacillus choshinensis]